MASSEGQVMQLTFSQKWHKSIEALLWGHSEPKVLFLWSAYRPVLVAGVSLAAISGVDAFCIAVLALLFLAALHGFLRYAQEPSQPPPGGPSHFEPLLESWRSLSSGRCKAAPTVAAERTPACSAHEQNSLQFEDVGVAQPMAQVARAWLHMARASRRPVHPPMKQGDTKHLGSSSDIGGSLTESDSAACTPWDLTDSDVGGIPQRTAAARRIEVVLERRLDEPWGFVWSTGTARARHRLVLDGVLTNSAAGCWNARQRELGLRALERGDLLVDANGARGSQPIQRELSAADFIKAGFLRPFAALPPPRPCLQASPVYEYRVKNSFIEVSCAGGAESHDDRHAMSDPGPFVTWPASLAFGPVAERNKVAGNVKQQILPIGGVSGTGSSKGFSEDDVSACYLTEAETVSDLIGARAVISGLVRSPEFNGHSCLIEAYDAEVKRYVVRVYLGDEGGPVTAKLRLENLSISPPAFSPVSMMPYILPHMQGHALNFWQTQQAPPSFFEWLQATKGFANNFQFMPGQVGTPCTEVVPLEPATSSACLEVLAQVSQPPGLCPGLGGEMEPFAKGVQASALSPGPPEPGLRNPNPNPTGSGFLDSEGTVPRNSSVSVALPVKHSDLAASAELQVPCESVPSDELQCLEPGASEEEVAQEEEGEEGAGVQPGRRKRRRGKRKRGRGHQGEEELELAEDKALHVLETEELLEDVNKGLVDSERAEEAKETELHAAETAVQEDVQQCTTCGPGYVSDNDMNESFKTLVHTSQLVDPLFADEEQAHHICSGADDEEKEGRLSDPEKCEDLTEIRPPEQKQLLIPHEQDDHQAVEEERDDRGAQELLPEKGTSHELALEDEQGSSLPHETKTSSEDYLAASEVHPQAPGFAGPYDETAPDDAGVTSSSSCLPASPPWRSSLQRDAAELGNYSSSLEEGRAAEEITRQGATEMTRGASSEISSESARLQQQGEEPAFRNLTNEMVQEEIVSMPVKNICLLQDQADKANAEENIQPTGAAYSLRSDEHADTGEDANTSNKACEERRRRHCDERKVSVRRSTGPEAATNLWQRAIGQVKEEAAVSASSGRGAFPETSSSQTTSASAEYRQDAVTLMAPSTLSTSSLAWRPRLSRAGVSVAVCDPSGEEYLQTSEKEINAESERGNGSGPLQHGKDEEESLSRKSDQFTDSQKPIGPSKFMHARGGQADSQQASGSAEPAELLSKSISGAVWRPTLRRL